MGGEETITVAEVSEGEHAGDPVELPVVELLTGRAFLTGKSGSGKSNTASVVIERLLDRGFGVLIVDIEGEYYGLKEEYEILHAGADEECDIQVREEHAGKLASLALEQNVPIILDLSGFLHEEDARELLKEVARQLFAREKKVKQPFLMVVEEIHEYVPEGGGMDECGRMLVKVAKRGRKHGLGVAGISQRPADVKKDFITQCDWLVWHRLTWQNDTRVVKRVLGDSYAEAIEGLGDGEGFLMTDWGEGVRRVQFHRKETFDAGATPGLEDFERPDLKSVSDDLVSELQTISEDQAAREDEIARLENELEERERRIAELKEELAEARDLSDMAEQFASAMTAQAEPRYDPDAQRDLEEYAEGEAAPSARNGAEAGGNGKLPAADEDEADESGERNGRDRLPPAQRAIVEEAAAANDDGVGEVTILDGGDDGAGEDAGPSTADDSAESADEPGIELAIGDGTAGGASGATTSEGGGGGAAAQASTDVEERTVTSPGGDADGPESVATELRARVADLDPVAREMLATYRDTGVAPPAVVHDAIGESGDREAAYSHNRELRHAGFVCHVGKGRYAYSLPSLVAARTDADLDDDQRRQLVGEVEAALSW